MDIIIDGITKTYDRQYAVDKLSFHKNPVLPGTSGANPTTAPNITDLSNLVKELYEKANYVRAISV